MGVEGVLVGDEDVLALVVLAGDLNAKHEGNAETAKRAKELDDNNCNCKSSVLFEFELLHVDAGCHCRVQVASGNPEADHHEAHVDQGGVVVAVVEVVADFVAEDAEELYQEHCAHKFISVVYFHMFYF